MQRCVLGPVERLPCSAAGPERTRRHRRRRTSSSAWRSAAVARGTAPCSARPGGLAILISGRMRWAVVGGGLIGRELASDLHKAGDAVAIFQRAPRPMEQQLSEAQSLALSACRRASARPMPGRCFADAGRCEHSTPLITFSDGVEVLQQELLSRLVAQCHAVRQPGACALALGLAGDERDLAAHVGDQGLGNRHASQAGSDDDDVHAATCVKSDFPAPQSGQIQLSGRTFRRAVSAFERSGRP